ncbi:hypothetical protein BDZ89DRAFT_1079136 [Hymenopellis radicata]|nr:hypothetical protein BDZ89DRAFT_1079136 [Hymenopellis radicata]
MNGAADFDIDGLLDTVSLPFRTISNKFQMTATLLFGAFRLLILADTLLTSSSFSVMRPLRDTPISLMFVSPLTHACLALPKS